MQATANLEIGQMAPDFSLKGPGGQAVTLSEYRGKKNVVLVFYPLAFSPTCAHQLPTLQKEMARFADLDAVVLGISIDSHYANEAFARHLGLEFPLLSDFNRQVITAYGLFNAERGYSRRAILVIDKQGRLAHKDVSDASGELPSNARVLDVLGTLR